MHKNTKGFVRAIKFVNNPFLLLEYSDDYSHTYSITLKIVERLIIEKLSDGGWTAKQIQLATNFNIRTIFRVIKIQKENNE